MSPQLQQLRSLLKEDIDYLVEQQLAQRLPSIIEALYPSIMEHIANNMHLTNHGNNTYAQVNASLMSYEIMKPEMDFVSLTINTGPGSLRHIGSAFSVFDQQKYAARIEYIYKHIRDAQEHAARIDQDLQQLKQQINK